MTEHKHPRRADLDARSIVPVTDDIGGVVLYVAGEPAYYVLNGEWFEALPGIGAASRSERPRDQRGLAIRSGETAPDRFAYS